MKITFDFEISEAEMRIIAEAYRDEYKYRNCRENTRQRRDENHRNRSRNYTKPRQIIADPTTTEKKILTDLENVRRAFYDERAKLNRQIAEIEHQLNAQFVD